MTPVELASWNIRKCVGIDRRRDPGRVARVLADLGSDIVALQEADRRIRRRPAALPEWLIGAETPYRVADARGFDGSIGWHGNALLLGPGFGCEEIHALNLPGLEPRGALVADIEGKGRAIRVVAVHLGLLRSYRQKQLAAILGHLDTLAERPTIILGDFNEWSKARGLESLGRFRVHAPGRTYHASRPFAALDRIALGPGVELQSSEVVTTPMSRVASDHLPIRARVTVPSRSEFRHRSQATAP